MLRLRHDDPLALSLGGAIRNGDLASLKQLVREHPDLVTARIEKNGKARTSLHVATDWPGHFSNGPAVIAALIEAGYLSNTMEATKIASADYRQKLAEAVAKALE